MYKFYLSVTYSMSVFKKTVNDDISAKIVPATDGLVNIYIRTQDQQSLCTYYKWNHSLKTVKWTIAVVKDCCSMSLDLAMMFFLLSFCLSFLKWSAHFSSGNLPHIRQGIWPSCGRTEAGPQHHTLGQFRWSVLLRLVVQVIILSWIWVIVWLEKHLVKIEQWEVSSIFFLK